MAVIKYDPFKEIEKFFEDDTFNPFPAFRRRMGPAMDIYQTEKEVVVEVQAPHMDPSKIDVTMEDGILKIEGRDEEEKKEEGKNYVRREIRRGSFQRMVNIAIPVKENQIEASYENGILKVVIPKAEVKEAKKIEVKIKEK